jgi:hypothetical protein
MSTRVSIDRFDGDSKEYAVLLTQEGLGLRIPRSLLPKNAKPGDVFQVELKFDAAATQALEDEIRALQADLRKRDTGGDIEI